MSGRWFESRSIARLCALAVAVISVVHAGYAGGFAGLGERAGEQAPGFAEVAPGKVFAFPKDHGAHSDFRIEWWYLTANLVDETGAAYGVQWTLFRTALAPGATGEGFATAQTWMGHAAVTSADRHVFAETMARGGIGQAGVDDTPFRAYIDDWEFRASDAGLSRATVSARGDRFSYQLELSNDKPMVLQGESGFSRKSEGGQASYYYSAPFFRVSGRVVLDGRELRVTGEAWMDREWSSQLLSADQTGWDWFSLHLPQGAKLMAFRLRGSSHQHFYSGTWIEADGRTTPLGAGPLGAGDIVVEPIGTSEVVGRAMPLRWRLRVAGKGLDIETRPLNESAWMATSFPYWEGPIQFSGSHAGVGYLELTGY